ncbi:tail fiber assembly protein [Lonsdalea quercina]|uniref:tail fiber assembly protein n=1 Tax=Lonsdalea quercina TaxID=71657 RepID=UPI003F478E29
MVLSSPRADDYQTWDNKVKEWTLTEDAAVQKSADEKERLIKTASSEITRASTQIAILTDKIELDDYDSGETGGTVKASLIDWKKYRIACNSVVNGAATSLPDSP